MIFKNREEAGRQLVPELLQYRDDPRGLILALPRGGVGTEITRCVDRECDRQGGRAAH